MALSIVDYEKVDARLLSLLQLLQSTQELAAALNVAGTGTFVGQIDTFRNNVGMEIEKQGERG